MPTDPAALLLAARAATITRLSAATLTTGTISRLSALPRFLSTSSSDVDDDEKNTKTTRPRRRRRRHNFDVDQVPSFEAFQQQQNIRALYRSFLRLAYGTAARDELVSQIRREFRHAAPADGDPWAVKRALSDGGKRYKELAAMLSSVPGKTVSAASPNDDDDDDTTPPSPSWPWQSGTPPSKPLAFPKR